MEQRHSGVFIHYVEVALEGGGVKFRLDENIGRRCRDILTKAGQRCARHDPSVTINTSAVISKFPNKSKPAYPHFFQRNSRKLSQCNGERVSGQRKLISIALPRPDQPCAGG